MSGAPRGDRLEQALRLAWQQKVGAAGVRELVLALMFVVPLAVFLGGLRYLGSWDTYPNEILPARILQSHDFALNYAVADPNHLPYFLTKVHGRVVSIFPIVPALLQLPVYAAAAAMGVNPSDNIKLLSLISSSIISALSVVFIYLALRRVMARELSAIFLALVYAFGTAVWSVTSRGIWQHGPSLLFIALSLYLILTGDRRFIALSGFFLAMALWNRLSTGFIALPLGFYAIYTLPRPRGRWAAAFAGLAAIPIFFMSLYSYSYLDSVAALGQAQPLGHLNGRMLSGVLGLLFSPSRGLLVFSPIFLPAMLYLPYALFARRAPLLNRLLGLSVVSTILFVAKWPMWWGGWCFGYRMLIEIVPPLMLLLAAAWQQVISRRLWARVAFLAFALISVYVHLLGAFVYPTGFDSTIGVRTAFSQEVPRNANLARLWVVRDSELARCTEKLLAGRREPPPHPLPDDR